MIFETKRVKWKGITIGSHGYATFSYRGNNSIRIIPRATGVKIWSTKELGGGYLEITVRCLILKEERTKLEKFFADFDNLFTSTEKGTLTLEGLTITLVLTDCYLQGWSQEDRDLKVNWLTLNFIKSL